jgi:membrane protease YdiL (CAAX protease family)
MAEADLEMTTLQTDVAPQLPASSAPSPLRSRVIFVGELSALITLTVADAYGLVPLSRTPFLLLLAWVSLRLRGLKWADIGLRRPPRMKHAIAVGIVAGLAIELFAINFTTPWIAALTGAPPDVSDFRIVIGNVQLLLIFVVISWILAAFGEELAFRGYLLNRFGDTLGGTPMAWVASLVMVSVYFGIGHGNQGVAGIVQESLSGFWLGVLFLLSRRNLIIPIVAHGISNTLAFVLIYFNQYPGLS